MVAGILEKSRRRRWARLLFIAIEKKLLFVSPTVPQVSWAAAPPVGNGETVFSSTCDARFFQEGNEIAFLRGRILFRYNPGQLTAASKRCIFAAVGRGAIAC